VLWPLGNMRGGGVDEMEAVQLDLGLRGTSQLTFAFEGSFHDRYVRTRHHVSSGGKESFACVED